MKAPWHWAFCLLCSVYFGLSCQGSEKSEEGPPEILAVFPSSDTLPENLLRMYVHFSDPMKPIGNLEHIHLLNDLGNEVEGAIFNNVYELWNREQTQLTLLLDPSRVKTGLTAHAERGRALGAGHRYRLQIDPLEDVAGNTTPAYAKSFFVVEEDRTAPDKSRWKLNIPRAGSQSPFVIRFPDLLDYHSLQQRLRVTDSLLQPISGSPLIGRQEREWQFVPDRPWAAATYILHIHTRLEDPAGNNLNGLFDHAPGSLKYATEDAIEPIEFEIPL